MTQQEIQERNKQIALMLGTIKGRDPFGNFIDGIQYNKIGTEREWCFHFNQTALKTQTSAVSWKVLYKIEELRFHLDWNWLMEAVEFIEKSGYNIEICSYHGNDSLHYCAIHQLIDKDTNDITSIIKPKHSNIKTEAVFIVVSDFAKLYSENKL